MRNRIYYCLLFWGSFISSYAQTPNPAKEIPILLNKELNNSDFEFSGLTYWKDQLLLIPQNRHISDDFSIIMIDTTLIGKAINNRRDTINEYRRLFLSQELKSRLKILDTTIYGGFEAATVNNNTIYLTIETSTSYCFILKGTITSNLIMYDTIVKIEKPDNCFCNAGFESIVYLKDQNKILTFYERNRTRDAYALMFDPSLRQAPQKVPFSPPLYFRLTDAAAAGDNRMYGINYFYNGDYAESCYYLGDASIFRELKGRSFCQVISMKLENGMIEYLPGKNKFITFDSKNWEGIVSFRKGVLMVLDDRPSSGFKSRLSYFPL